jgi:DNA-binding NarL/FixJ family response regulator
LPQPKIYAFTGHTEEQFVTRAIEAGMEEVIGKPVDMDKVRDIVRRLSWKHMDILSSGFLKLDDSFEEERGK